MGYGAIENGTANANVKATIDASDEKGFMVGGLIGENLFVSAFLEEHPTPSPYVPFGALRRHPRMYRAPSKDAYDRPRGVKW